MIRGTSTLRAAALAATLLAGLAGAARAQYEGQMVPLRQMTQGDRRIAGYLGAGLGAVGPLVEYRVNFLRKGTGGLQAGVANKIFGARADLTGALMETGGDYPLAVGGELAAGVTAGGEAVGTGLFLQGVPAVSFEFSGPNGQSGALWGGLGARFTTSNKSIGRLRGLYRFGAGYEVTETVGISGCLEDAGDGGAFTVIGLHYYFGTRGSSTSGNAPGR